MLELMGKISDTCIHDNVEPYGMIRFLVTEDEEDSAVALGAKCINKC